VAVVRGALAERDIDLDVISGEEVAVPRLSGLDDHSLQDLCLGPGTYLLVESPYSASPFLEDLLFDLQTRGFRPLLAHPERCPIFHRDRTLLERLVAQGVLCSITAASLVGGFGRTVRRFTQDILSAGLVHDIASDAHDTARRPRGSPQGSMPSGRICPSSQA
jgi:protein-tyrosine phosphatase